MIALIGIMVQSPEAVETVNGILHDFRHTVRGRTGLPLADKNLNVISVVLDTDAGQINGLCGKLGNVAGVKAKALYGNL